jgi:hypothetical protein
MPVVGDPVGVPVGLPVEGVYLSKSGELAGAASAGEGTAHWPVEPQSGRTWSLGCPETPYLGFQAGMYSVGSAEGEPVGIPCGTGGRGGSSWDSCGAPVEGVLL